MFSERVCICKIAQSVLTCLFGVAFLSLGKYYDIFRIFSWTLEMMLIYDQENVWIFTISKYFFWHGRLRPHRIYLANTCTKLLCKASWILASSSDGQILQQDPLALGSVLYPGQPGCSLLSASATLCPHHCWSPQNPLHLLFHPRPLQFTGRT